MLRYTRVVALLGALAAAPAQAVEESGATFPDQVSYAGHTLPVYSHGLLRKYFIKVYAGALYLPPGEEASNYPQDISKCLILHYFLALDGEDIGPAGDQVMARMYPPAGMAGLKDRLARFNAAYEDVGDGDEYRLCYAPGAGTTLARNGKDLVTIDGADFAAAYFSLWLGSDPVDKRLRKALYTPR